MVTVPFHTGIKKGDMIVAGAVLFLVAALIIVNRAYLALGPPGGYAFVEIENQLVMEVSLEDYPRQVPLTLPRGEGVLDIDQGKIRIMPMPRETCPLNICSSVGFIDKPGQAIVCLPNRMIITIQGEVEDPLNLDGITN